MNLRAWLVLLTLCGATFMTGLDYSIITVALPEIGRGLGFASANDLQWVATACLLPTAALMPLFGRVSDVVGRRRLFAAGVALFAAFSLVGGLAVSPAMLVAARAGQGVAAAMVGPSALALMKTVFPEGPQRTRALGVNGALLSLGFVIGTIGGGLITSGLNWRWTMLLLVGLGALVLAGALTVVPGPDVRSAARLDVPGAVLASLGLFALVYGISSGVWIAVLLAAALLGGFLVVETRHPAPLIPPRLMRRPTVTWGMAMGLVTFGMCGGATLLLSIYMQDVLGYTALQTGLGFLAEGGAALVAGSFAARLIARVGTRGAMMAGLLIQGAGIAAMTLLPGSGGALWLLLLSSGVMGLGHVLSVVAVVTTVTSGLEAADQGVAASLAQMPTFVGSVGTALLVAISASAGLAAAFLTAGLITLAGAAALLPASRALAGTAPHPDPRRQAPAAARR